MPCKSCADRKRVRCSVSAPRRDWGEDERCSITAKKKLQLASKTSALVASSPGPHHRHKSILVYEFPYVSHLLLQIIYVERSADRAERADSVKIERTSYAA